ncbi:hypothetical protein BJX62DRAFT_54026 [Aspergillus germanicus]
MILSLAACTSSQSLKTREASFFTKGWTHEIRTPRKFCDTRMFPAIYPVGWNDDGTSPQVVRPKQFGCIPNDQISIESKAILAPGNALACYKSESSTHPLVARSLESRQTRVASNASSLSPSLTLCYVLLRRLGALTRCRARLPHLAVKPSRKERQWTDYSAFLIRYDFQREGMTTVRCLPDLIQAQQGRSEHNNRAFLISTISMGRSDPRAFLFRYDIDKEGATNRTFLI